MPNQVWYAVRAISINEDLLIFLCNESLHTQRHNLLKMRFQKVDEGNQSSKTIKPQI